MEFNLNGSENEGGTNYNFEVASSGDPMKWKTLGCRFPFRLQNDLEGTQSLRTFVVEGGCNDPSPSNAYGNPTDLIHRVLCYGDTFPAASL